MARAPCSGMENPCLAVMVRRQRRDGQARAVARRCCAESLEGVSRNAFGLMEDIVKYTHQKHKGTGQELSDICEGLAARSATVESCAQEPHNSQ